jgi:hypothetical protein
MDVNDGSWAIVLLSELTVQRRSSPCLLPFRVNARPTMISESLILGNNIFMLLYFMAVYRYYKALGPKARPVILECVTYAYDNSISSCAEGEGLS